MEELLHQWRGNAVGISKERTVRLFSNVAKKKHGRILALHIHLPKNLQWNVLVSCQSTYISDISPKKKSNPFSLCSNFLSHQLPNLRDFVARTGASQIGRPEFDNFNHRAPALLELWIELPQVRTNWVESGSPKVWSSLVGNSTGSFGNLPSLKPTAKAPENGWLEF